MECHGRSWKVWKAVTKEVTKEVTKRLVTVTVTEMLYQASTLREAFDVVCVVDPQLTSLMIGKTHQGILLSLKSFLKKFKTISDHVEGSQ